MRQGACQLADRRSLDKRPLVSHANTVKIKASQGNRPEAKQERPSMKLTQIALSAIAAPSNARTQNGYDKDSIRQLADSIIAQGLLQPIMVRPMTDDERNDPEKYALFPHLEWVIVVGRRRLQACKVAGLDTVDAVVSEKDEEAAYLSEIAENLQREDMTLADTARAVRTLMAIYDDQKKVAAMLSKSAAWVSKHLSVTASKCPQEVRALMENNVVSDLETLLLLRQIMELSPAKHPGKDAAVARMLRIAAEGNMSRVLARDTLAKLRTPDPVAPPAPSVRRVLTTGATEVTTTEAGEADPRTEFTVTLPIKLLAKLERLGGMHWLAVQIDMADEPGLNTDLPA
jgi:ParB/RepB/Spo0J family partition protein